MNWESVATVAVCVACLLAVSTAASTMESTLSTNPDDVIDVDSSDLPIGSESVLSVKSQVQSQGDTGDSGSGGQQGSSSQSAAAGGDSGEQSQQKAKAGDGSKQSRSKRDGSGSGGGAASDEQQQQQSSNGGGGGSSVVPMATESLLDRLVDLLRALLSALGALLPIAALLAAVALAIRYRDALRDAIRARLEAWGVVESEPEYVPRVQSEPKPETEVAEAWYEFVEALGLGDVRSCAPQECAARARDAGVDEDVVEDVSEPFAEVKYGRAPETEERRQRARNGLERFRAQYDGGDS